MAKDSSKIPLAHSFFGFVTLENGTVFILWATVILGVLIMFIPSSTVRIHGISPPTEFWESLGETQETWSRVLGENSAMIPKISDPGIIEGEIHFGNSWIFIPVGLITIFVSGLGLYGVFEDNSIKYLFPYISWCIAGIVLLLLMLLFSPVGIMVILFIVFLLNLAFILYCVWIVYSYYTVTRSKAGKYEYKRVHTAVA